MKRFSRSSDTKIVLPSYDEIWKQMLYDRRLHMALQVGELLKKCIKSVVQKCVQYSDINSVYELNTAKLSKYFNKLLL